MSFHSVYINIFQLPSLQIMFSLIPWKYILFQNLTHKVNCDLGLCLLKLGEGSCDIIQFRHKNHSFSKNSKKSILDRTLRATWSATIHGATPNWTWRCLTHVVNFGSFQLRRGPSHKSSVVTESKKGGALRLKKGHYKFRQVLAITKLFILSGCFKKSYYNVTLKIFNAA